MQLFIIAGREGHPVLTADILSAKINDLESEPYVCLETSSGREERFQPLCPDRKQAMRQCELCFQYIIDGIRNNERLVEVDEEAGFREDLRGIVALSRRPF